MMIVPCIVFSRHAQTKPRITKLRISYVNLWEQVDNTKTRVKVFFVEKQLSTTVLLPTPFEPPVWKGFCCPEICNLLDETADLQGLWSV